MSHPTTTSLGLATSNNSIGTPTRIPSGTYDPDGNPLVIKEETVIYRADPSSPAEYQHTIKMNRWSGLPDLRLHTHPWVSFQGLVVKGKIRFETWDLRYPRFTPNYSTYTEGEVHTSHWYEAHMVTEVDPGTVTIMHCGENLPGGAWGHFNSYDLTLTPAVSGSQELLGELFPELTVLMPVLASASFMRDFKLLNPHLPR